MSSFLHPRLQPAALLHRLLGAFVLLLLMLLGNLSSQAQTVVYGLGTLTRTIPVNTSPIYPPGAPAGAQGIASFDPSTGSLNSNVIALITGLTGNQKLVGIDFRPLTGQLYALGYDPALMTANAQLYTVDPKSGIATAVSAAPISLALGAATERIGFNFNPVDDVARVVSANDTNYRISPITGDLVTDGTLAYATTDPNKTRNPRISGAAYTNPYNGATSTILHDVENLNDASAPSGIFSSQSPPNNGTLNTEGSIRLQSPSNPTTFYGIDATARINVDIFWTGTYNKGYLLELTAPNGSGLSSSNLYDLSLPASTTSPADPANTNPVGYASTKRNMIGAYIATPFNLLAIAVAPTPIITSLSPPSAEVGTAGLTLTVNGSGFVNGTVVNYNGSTRTTTYVSATKLTASLTIADLATVGTYNVTVTNPPFPSVPSAPATFTVTPTCAAPTNLTAGNVTSNSATVSFTGNGSATSYTVTTSPTTPSQTLPGSATSVSLTGLTPSTSYTVSITTTCPSGTTSAATVTFTTSVAAATLAVSQNGTSYPNSGTAYTFGNQTVNTTSPVVAFTLTNGGTDPLIIGNISTTGNYAVSGTAPTTVPAGGTATVNVTFTPTATGTRPGTLVINSNATNGATYTVNLTGNGSVLPAPTLAVTQAGASYPSGGTAYNFGNQLVNTTNPAVTFTLTNSGNTTLAIGSISTTGDYAVNGTAPTTVPAGGMATVNVTFTPTATGTRPGTLVINSNATNGAIYTVNLTGNGQAATANPQIAVSQGGNGIANGGTFTGFASTQQGSTSAPVTFTISNGSPTDALTLETFTFSGPYAPSGAAPTSVAPGGTATFSVTFSPTAVGANTGSVSIANNSQTNNPYLINFSGQGTSQDLIVNTPQAVQGSYRNVTIVGPNGVATLSGALTVTGTLTVLTGGALVQNCQAITGKGNFDLQAGGAIAICDPAGIATVGATGAVQVTGTRSFSPQASYLYNGTMAQVTGSGLPSQVLNLGVLNPANITLSQAVAVAGVVRLQSGSLDTGGRTLTLLSSAAGTALVDNSGGGTVVGTATVQRYINSSNALGYRHYSAPVSNTTLADLSAPGFTPTFNTAYNSSATPGTVTSFPTVFGYDQSRIATVTSNFSAFDKGWFSPVAADPMVVAQGYTVNVPNTALIDFVGTLNNGLISTGTLSRGPDPSAGWQLVGNPYPSPIDWSTITAGQRPGMDAAVYVFESAGQYGGSYRTNVNGVGGNGNVSPLIVSGSGCFVRVSTPNGTGSVKLNNSNRVTTFGAQPNFGRGTVDVRPQVALTLQGASVSDAAYVYFQAEATAGKDVEFDATKLANPTGLNLSSLAGGEALAINGLPALGTAPVLVPLYVAAPQAGSYALTASALTNLAGTSVTLLDALTGTRTVLTAGTAYAFSLSSTSAPGRFALEFRPSGALATTAAQALNAQLQLFPNPASGSFRVQLPVLAAKTAVQATLLNALGQTMLHRSLSAAAGQALDTEFEVRALAAGVYTLRLDVAGTLVTRKVVVE